jgi:hypothetical protein
VSALRERIGGPPARATDKGKQRENDREGLEEPPGEASVGEAIHDVTGVVEQRPVAG